MPNTTPRPPKSTTQKGLGYDHQVHRDRLLLRHVDGTPCWWDGRPMYREPSRNWDGKPLHAEHSKSRSIYGTAGNQADRLMHDTCNKQRGDGSRDDQRPALNPELLTELDTSRELLGDLYYFAWPA
ncbi:MULTISPECIES: hypothetical protein [unclassified Mycobacterium]|uniref:hypothetical protein n=1 Tax=unclassified Mycobacterium TaxID=2642494 RepID=UPI0029C82EBB|nr:MULTISPECIES: hypothetical protein [unclassified Mycobacterium]